MIEEQKNDKHSESANSAKLHVVRTRHVIRIYSITNGEFIEQVERCVQFSGREGYISYKGKRLRLALLAPEPFEALV